MALAADDAAYADDMLDRTLAAACRQVTAEGTSIDAALVGHFRYLRTCWPETYAVIVARLRETDSPLLSYVEEGRIL